jgi:methyl-accepting chemotaxis protein
MGQMTTKIATVTASGSAESVAMRLKRQLTEDLGVTPALVVVFASTEQPLDRLMPLLADGFPIVLGASTAGEFTQDGDTKGTVSAFALAGDYKVFAGLGHGIKANAERAVERALEGQPRDVRGYPNRTALLLVDPLSGNGEEVTLHVASALGIEEPLAGGAAGDDLKMSGTKVACGAHAMSDALVVAQIFSREPLGIGVCHGHRPLSRPLKVTRAIGGTVYEIEERPAWDVWLEETREQARVNHIDPSKNETAFLLRFEAGLANGAEYKIRAPLSRNADGSINFATAIPECAVIRITQSDAAAQISSARTAAKRARERLGGKPVAGAIVFDCICRNLILGPDFASAVRGISAELGGAPLAGFETYGEIAMSAGDMSGFHNTTSVVLAFPK